MPYDTWRDTHQREASDEQRKAFDKSFAQNVGRAE